jgi:hypothetical protein
MLSRRSPLLPMKINTYGASLARVTTPLNQLIKLSSKDQSHLNLGSIFENPGHQANAKSSIG